jgi:uncharacterized protein (TIGR02246 family)
MPYSTRNASLTLILAIGSISILYCSSGGGTRSSNAPEPNPNQPPADERAIHRIIDNENETWNKGDAVGYSRDFARDGIFTNIRGQAFDGYDAFVRQHDVIFKGIFRGTRLQQEIDVVRFPEPGVALVETITAVLGVSQPPPGVTLDAQGRMRTRLLQVVVKRGGEWKIVAYHNVDIKPGTTVPTR